MSSYNKKNYNLDNIFGKVFRHNRLFNYVVIPMNIDENVVNCQVGNGSFREFPLDYFLRDWHEDSNINPIEIKDKILEYPNETPFTVVYDAFYEIDDGSKHSFIHFNDDIMEKMVRFPLWRLTTCTKQERKKLINPFTLIMPVIDDKVDEIEKDLAIMNEIRKSNEFISIDDFQGFEFGLIKYLEKKYLRII